MAGSNREAPLSRNHPLTLPVLILAGEAAFALPFVLPRVFRPTLLSVFGISNFELGTAFSLYGVVAMLSYFPGGPLADRFQPRALMAAALGATALGGLFYATVPAHAELQLLFAYWGLTTVLLFWAALLRATRAWGGVEAQGKAFGLLDGGRGLVAALVSSAVWWVFAAMMPDDPASATPEELRAALQAVILAVTALTAVAAALVFLVLPPDASLSAERPRGLTRGTVRVALRQRALWLQGVVVVCAYCGYKGTDDLSLLAADVLGYDDVAAAGVGTAAFYLRPIAAVAAGYLADRVGSSRVLAGCFALLVVAHGMVAAGAALPGPAWLVLTGVTSVAAGVYALRGVYFALFEEAQVPAAWTGTAIGLVSVVGYTPDIFMGPLMGWLLDRKPGAAGHADVFALLAAISLVGLVTTLSFRRVTRGQAAAAA